MKDRQRHARVFNTAPASTKDRLKTARPRADLLKGKKDWYRIENLAGSGTASIYIYDEIGYWGITATDFIRELNAVTASRIDLHLNSPGGEAFEGVAIYSALKQHAAEVHVYVDSLAASIASVIAMAGDTITMGTGSTMMIHLASGLEIGNADDLRRYADVLDVVSGNAAAIYAERAGGTPEQWLETMRAETWYTAEEAVAAGLADEVTAVRARDVVVPQNSWDLSIFNYAGREHAPAPPPRATGGVIPATASTTPASLAAQFSDWLANEVRKVASLRDPAPTTPENNEVDTVPVVVPEVSREPESVTSQEGEPAAVDEQPVVPVEPAAEVAETDPVAMAPDPAPETEPTAPAAVVPAPEPDPAPIDDAPVVAAWAAITSGLIPTEPASPSPADVFDALKKGLLR